MSEIAQLLLAKKLITKSQMEGALLRHRSFGTPVPDGLVEAGVLSEESMLKFMASLYKTGHITRSSLNGVDPDKNILKSLSRSFAAEERLVPLRMDPASSTLVLAMAAPDNKDAARRAMERVGARRVQVLVTLDSAIEASIYKFYDGQDFAFYNLLSQDNMMNYFSGNVFEASDISGEKEAIPSLDSTMEAIPLERETGFDGPSAAPSVAPQEEPAVPTSLGSFLVMSEDQYMGVLDALIRLLDVQNKYLKGHATHVSSLVQDVSDHLGMDETQLRAHALGAYLHDVGMQDRAHLTLFALLGPTGKERRPLLLKAAQQRLFSDLPPQVGAIISHRFEAFDGSGVPRGLKGKQIPQGARILAVVDAYEELTRNRHRKQVFDGSKAIQIIMRYGNALFDREVIEALAYVLMKKGQLKRQSREGEEATRVLILDANISAARGLEVRLASEGIESVVVVDLQEALALLQAGDISGALVSVDPGWDEGIMLCRAIRSEASLSRIPIFLMGDAEMDDRAQLGLEAGAEDFLPRPLNARLFATKLQRVLARRQAANEAQEASQSMAGSLKDLPLADILQILCTGQKTGRLLLRKGPEKADIYLERGNIVQAYYGDLSGTQAFYPLLAWADGRFSLDPRATIPPRAIFDSPDGLILEGFRLMDESRRT